MGQVKSFYSNPDALLKLIRQIARESANVFIPQRDSGHIIGEIGTSLIFACLEKGELTQQPEPDKFDNQCCELTYHVAGQEISIALAVDIENRKIHILHVEG